MKDCRIIYTPNNINSDEDKLPPLCNYLIYIQDGDFEEVIPCNSITKTIEIASNSKRMCRIFERTGSLGKNWRYLCDLSKGII